MEKRITINNEELTLEEAFEKFLIAKRSMNLSEETIKSYVYVFEHFSRFFDVTKSSEELKEEDIYGFTNFLRQRNEDVSDVTLNHFLRRIRSIFYFFMQRKYIAGFPIRLIK